MKKKRIIASLLLLCLVLGAIWALTHSLFASMKRSLYQERQKHLEEMTGQSARMLDQNIADTWELVSLFHAFLEDDLQQNIDVFDSARTFNKKYTDESIGVMFFDDMGRFYWRGGNVGKQNNLVRLMEDSPSQQVYIEKRPFEEDKEEDMIYFLQRLDKPVKAQFLGESITITHFALVRSMEYMLSCFYREFANASNAFILDKDGMMLYKRYELGVLIEGSNYFTKLRQSCHFFHRGEDVEDLITRMQDGRTVCCEASYNLEGKTHLAYACMTKIGEHPWYLAFTVPTENIDSGTVNHMHEILWCMSGIVLLLGIAFVVLIFYIHHSAVEGELLRKKEEANLFLENAAAAAQEASMAKSEFLSHMSHDIRTPINGIMGMTDLARKNLGDRGKVSSCLEKIAISSHHLLQLINDVLDLSRIESGKTVLATDPINMGAVVANCSSIIRGQLETRQLKFEEDASGIRHPWVIGDELHLRQILVNILGNAVKFTPDGGSIFFTTKELPHDNDSCFMQFIVKDTGIGMKPEFVKHVFDAFSQEDDGARSQYKGTGLGMAITKKYIELMKGAIDVTSRQGEGTTFVVTLPCKLDKQNHKVVSEETAGSEDLKGARVLLVEDNEMNREIAQELLEAEGLEVICAENGKIAVDTFTRNAPDTFDFILMDVMMPVMDGLQATKCIRAQKRHDAKTIPILAMTANAFEEDIRRTREAGMNEHLSKPVQMEHVLKALRSFYKGDHPRPPVV